MICACIFTHPSKNQHLNSRQKRLYLERNSFLHIDMVWSVSFIWWLFFRIPIYVEDGQFLPVDSISEKRLHPPKIFHLKNMVVIMPSTLHYPDLVENQFNILNSTVLVPIEIEETRIAARASALVDDFIREKKALHARIKDDPINAGKSLYSPLIITARHYNGSLQITWRETHRVKSKDGQGRWKKHIPLPKGKATGYSIPRLKKSAGYDVDLVEKYEQRAAELRERWKQLMAFKKAVYTAMRRLPVIDANPLQGNIPAGQASTDAVSIDTLVPKPAPEPVLSPDKPRHRPSPGPSGPRPRRM